jgi:hypothetical protein
MDFRVFSCCHVIFSKGNISGQIKQPNNKSQIELLRVQIFIAQLVRTWKEKQLL